MGARPELLRSLLDVATEVHRQRYPAEAIELVTNLGRYQEVRLLHVHFIGGAKLGRRDDEIATTIDEAMECARSVLAHAGACRVIFRRGEEGDYSVAVR